MGKHMTIEERLNAQNEFDEIKAKLPKLRVQKNNLKYLMALKSSASKKAEYLAKINELSEQIDTLSKRRRKLCAFLKDRQKSKYNGLFRLQTESYKLLGKSRADFTREDWRIYDRYMHRLRREKEKENAKKK